MSFPKKAKGWRSITVNQQQFRWRFRLGDNSSPLTLQGHLSSGQRVIVRLEGWRDPWLSIPYKQPPNVPAIITPKFVSEAIHFALTQGWKPEEAQPPLLINVINGAFLLNDEE
jgi:hypothetical protein